MRLRAPRPLAGYRGWNPHNGAFVGYVTSGGYAHYSQKSMAMAYVPTELVQGEQQFEIEILGELKTRPYTIGSLV